MANTTVHTGPIAKLPEDSSPGLRFLKEYTPALDSLNPESPLPKFLSPNAVFIMNGATPTPFAEMEKMFQMRSQMLKDFHHDVTRAWDIEALDVRNGARTVMVDWTSTTILKQDAEGPFPSLDLSSRRFNLSRG